MNEALIWKVLAFITKSLDEKLERVRRKIDRNNDQFSQIQAMWSRTEEEIKLLRKPHKREMSTMDQVGMIFQMIQENPQYSDNSNLDFFALMKQQKNGVGFSFWYYEK